MQCIKVEQVALNLHSVVGVGAALKIDLPVFALSLLSSKTDPSHLRKGLSSCCNCLLSLEDNQAPDLGYRRSGEIPDNN